MGVSKSRKLSSMLHKCYSPYNKDPKVGVLPVGWLTARCSCSAQRFEEMISQQVSYSLNSLKGGYIGDYRGLLYGLLGGILGV